MWNWVCLGVGVRMMGLEALVRNARVRWGAKLGLDAVLAGLAGGAVAWIERGAWPGLAYLGAWILFSLIVSLAFRLPWQHYRVSDFRGMLRVGIAGVTLMLGGLVGTSGSADPSWRQTALVAALLTMVLWIALRAGFRAFHEGFHPWRVGWDRKACGKRTLIIGAGRAGVLVAQELRLHAELGADLVGFVDDAPEKQGVTIKGHPVLGPSGDLPSLVAELDIQQAIIAIPSASGRELRRIHDLLQALAVEVKTVPGIYNLLDGHSWRPVLQDVAIEDLLRREAVALDLQAIGRELHDKVVLITGAGGSIGSELARQVATFAPARLVLLGRGEFSLWEVERELRGRQPGLPIAVELCDIRNAIRLGQVFRHWKPEVVFHAAAHKHVPYLESHPEEALENNALGTFQVVKAALEGGCSTLVNISTDKAVSPANMLGASKRLGEMVVEAASGLGGEGRRYVSVRFGNVLGSRGSVVPLFREQIRRGGPVTVTHPDMTRFFMTIPEASQLVLQAGLLGQGGRIYVLDMGDPVRILDLAQDMIRLSGLKPGEDIEIVQAGIRPGEKLHEELFEDVSRVEPTAHPKVNAALPEVFEWPDAEAWAQNIRRLIALPDEDRRKAILAFMEKTLSDWSPAQAEKGAAWVDLTTRFTRDASGPWKTMS